MGCDIHLFVERRVDGQWVSVDRWKEEYPDEGVVVPYDERFYTGRNYDLFAILADVRNGVGFAGVDTGDGFRPISSPKDLPRDVSAEVREASDQWGVDGHSHSWFTLAELLAYDWTQTVTQRGVVNAVEFEEWERMKQWNPEPKSWCGDIVGKGIQHITEAEMREKVKALQEELNKGKMPRAVFEHELKTRFKDVYCKVQWQQSYAECCKEWWWRTVPRLLRLGAQEDVRVVFWFDN